MASGYKLQNTGGHNWMLIKEDSSYYVLDMSKPFCNCPSREHPYCKHIRFLAGIYDVMVDLPSPGVLDEVLNRMGHHEIDL